MHDPAKHPVNNLPITPAPPPGILVAGHFKSSFGYHVQRPQGTRDWLITYTISGEGRYRLAGETYMCGAGDVFILEPGTPHNYATATPSHPWECYWAHFIARPHWVNWLQLPPLAPGLLAQPIDNVPVRCRIEQAFMRLLQDNRVQDNQGIAAWQEDLTANALEEVLILIAQQHATAQHRPLDPRVESVLLLLNRRFNERLPVSELAQTVALSPSRLAHLFKAQVGVSIMETVVGLRLRQAARFLEFTALSIGEIAREVGFQSPFYFSRQFKVYYGCSPSHFRQEMRSKQIMPPSQTRSDSPPPEQDGEERL